MTEVRRVGVLALQGASEPHLERTRELGIEAISVRRPEDLERLTHLIIPGGESTTLHHLMELFALRNAIVRRFHEEGLALFGTCAGAILLGRDDGNRPPRLGLLDVDFARNAYGRQIESRLESAVLEGLGVRPYPCVFIRAPKATRIGDGVEVLGRVGGDPVLLRSGTLLAATFHPELTPDLRIHELFLETMGKTQG